MRKNDFVGYLIDFIGLRMPPKKIPLMIDIDIDYTE